LKALIDSKALPRDAAARARASAYAGKYTVSGAPAVTVEIIEDNGALAYSFEGQASTLTEVEPGLYFSPAGDVFDTRGPTPTLGNIRLVKANTQALPFDIAFYALCGLVFLSALFFWPARALVRSIRRKSAPVDDGTVRPPRNPWLAWAGGLAALAALFSLICLAMIALVPNLVYVPWPRPYADLLWWQSALLSLPFASLLLAMGIALLAVLSMRRHAWARATHVYYLIVALALFAFNSVLLI
jgi:hypothetical protein